MKKIAVLIPIFNGLDYTKKCLDNLYEIEKQGYNPNFKFIIIIIDDGSSDGSSDYIQKNYPGVILLKGDGNQWWSGSVNIGAEYAINELNIDYLLLWNNDIIAELNYYNVITKILDSSTDKNLIIGSKILTQDGEIWSLGGTFNPTTGKIIQIGYGREISLNFNNVLEVDWLPGMGTLIPANVIKNIGYWDQKNFPQYHGDSDFTLRAKNNGYSIKVFQNLCIYNDTSNTGILHSGSFRLLLKSLIDVKSYTNIKKDIVFYRRFAKSPRAYSILFIKYFKLFGGFFKWKILNLVGISKKTI
ncbi:MAG: glycosyltransferase family 2 protein [Bacteroidales bacterium]|nr:glycosyltransferase family 2 protein [Bacteroidales bacterium]